ncbi:MAG: ComA-related protein [uncultured Rubrobacteraceae bacterium]|uniref:ComA-related protein n=1 Tax=uncultured Rubrobacteraceae bacterium TaxID=349277 RepID=A0A6J4PNB7_9ACTN|nr:MAG: ComA-related protein [uncultured Rubrobacteraceae bacterium]
MGAEEGRTSSRLGLRGELLAPNGYLHAATVVALTGTSCGHGTFANLPDGAERFTTIELESIFLGTARRGTSSARRGASTAGVPPRCGTPPLQARRRPSHSPTARK